MRLFPIDGEDYTAFDRVLIVALIVACMGLAAFGGFMGWLSSAFASLPL